MLLTSPNSCIVQTALHVAAAQGLENSLGALLQAGADKMMRNKQGETALHRSMALGEIRASLTLLESGAQLGDVLVPQDKSRTGRQTKCRSQDNRGRTPLDLLSATLKQHIVDAAAAGRGAEVFSFGKADYQLGYEPSNEVYVQHPRRVSALKRSDVVRIAASQHTSMAVTLDGALYSWGHSKSGRLGHGDESVQMLPKRVEALNRVVITDVSAAECHAAAVSSDGELFTWGSNRFLQLGLGKDCGSCCTAPRRVEALRRHAVVRAAAGTCHTAAVTAEGELYTWGSNIKSQVSFTADTIDLIAVQLLVSHQ
jgi:hypothetical protein